MAAGTRFEVSAVFHWIRFFSLPAGVVLPAGSVVAWSGSRYDECVVATYAQSFRNLRFANPPASADAWRSDTRLELSDQEA